MTTIRERNTEWRRLVPGPGWVRHPMPGDERRREQLYSEAIADRDSLLALVDELVKALKTVRDDPDVPDGIRTRIVPTALDHAKEVTDG